MDRRYAYLAGLVDGEGSITLDTSKNANGDECYYPRIDVGMSNRALPLLEMLREQFGGNIHRQRKRDPRWTQPSAWRICGDAAAQLLWEIAPFLRLKGRQAWLAIEIGAMVRWVGGGAGARGAWTREMRERGSRIKREIHGLNRRGPQEPVFPPGSFAAFADGQWVTPQRTLLGTWEPFSGTWPRSGSVSSTTAYLRAPSAPLTFGIESGSSESWPTPRASDADAGPTPASSTRGANLRRAVAVRGSRPILPTPTRESYGSMGSGVYPSLDTMARHALWPTPRRSGARSSATPRRLWDRHRNLETAVARTLWPTPSQAMNAGYAGEEAHARRTAGGHRGGHRGNELLRRVHQRAMFPTPTASMETFQDMEQARFSGDDPRRPSYGDVGRPWPTPTVTDERSGDRRRAEREHNRGRGANLRDAVMAAEPADGPRCGPLNPRWIEWLMGWPLGWTGPEPLDATDLEAWAAAGSDWWIEPEGLERTDPDGTEPQARPRRGALGDGQVPLCMAIAFLILTDALETFE